MKKKKNEIKNTMRKNDEEKCKMINMVLGNFAGKKKKNNNINK